MASSVSDPLVWTTTHRISSHPAATSTFTSTPTQPTTTTAAPPPPLSTGSVVTTGTDTLVHVPLAQPQDATYTCFLCSRHGTRGAQLYAVVCKCPLEARRSLHRPCAARIGEMNCEDDIRCRMCGVQFDRVRAKSSAMLFWRDVLYGTTAGFAQPFIVLVHIVIFLAISIVHQRHEDGDISSSFLEYIHFWVVPVVAFLVWSTQRLLVEHVVPWRQQHWLRFAKPWSCIAPRTVFPIAIGVQYNSPGPVASSIPPMTVSWGRLCMALCCDVAITFGTLWTNYHFAPIHAVPYSPFVVLLLSFALALVYAKVFRKFSNSIVLGEPRPCVASADASLTGQWKSIITEL